MQIVNLKKEIVSIITEHLGSDYLLIVFGSFARKHETKSSDLDLAVYKEGGISAKLMAEITEGINEKAHTLREIDLVNLTDAATNADLIKNIISEGIIWKKPKNSKELLKSLKKRFLNTEK